MAYTEPVIPIATPAGEDTMIPTPIAPGIYGAMTNRAIRNTYFKLDTYTIGTDIPKAVHIPNSGVTRKAVLTIEKNYAPIGGAATILARYWLDGTWPTQTTGIPLRDGDKITIEGADDIGNCRIVSADANEHIIQVQLYN